MNQERTFVASAALAAAFAAAFAAAVASALAAAAALAAAPAALAAASAAIAVTASAGSVSVSARLFRRHPHGDVAPYEACYHPKYIDTYLFDNFKASYRLTSSRTMQPGDDIRKRFFSFSSHREGGEK